jgi:hypothetical protein
MLRLLTNAARIDEDKISCVRVFRLGIRVSFQDPKHPLGIVFVHLTTIGFDIDPLLRWHICSDIVWDVIPTPYQARGKLQWESRKENLDSCFRRNDFSTKGISNSDSG